MGLLTRHERQTLNAEEERALRRLRKPMARGVRRGTIDPDDLPAHHRVWALQARNRREKANNTWGDVRDAIVKWGPAVVDVIQQIAGAPRVDRPFAAARAILDHADIALTEAGQPEVSDLARVLAAAAGLEDDHEDHDEPDE